MNSPSSRASSESKTNCKSSGTSISQQLSEIYPCAALCERKFMTQENDTFDGTCQNPWTVNQTENAAQVTSYQNLINSHLRTGDPWWI